MVHAGSVCKARQLKTTHIHLAYVQSNTKHVVSNRQKNLVDASEEQYQGSMADFLKNSFVSLKRTLFQWSYHRYHRY